MNWLASNSAALVAIFAAAPILWAGIQFIFAKRAEAKRLRFETYHSLIRQLVEGENPDQPMRLDRQVAVVFELRNFKHYYPVTLRILEGLKSNWSSEEYGPPDKRKRLLEELDLAIEHISRRPNWSFKRTLVRARANAA